MARQTGARIQESNPRKAVEVRRDLFDLASDDIVFRELHSNIVIVHQHLEGSHEHPYMEAIPARYGYRHVWGDTHAHIAERGAS